MGDSYTSGENNGFRSYVDHLNWEGCIIDSIGISGTTMGEYSIYPVDGQSLLAQIKENAQKIAEADEIFLEYGANDVTAIITGNTSYRQVLIAFVKAIDAIKQLNPLAKIRFLALSDNKNIIGSYASYQYKYLKEDYLKEYGVPGLVLDWTYYYSSLVEDIAKKIPVLSITRSRQQIVKYMSEDGIHPTDEGYKEIARIISEELKR